MIEIGLKEEVDVNEVLHTHPGPTGTINTGELPAGCSGAFCDCGVVMSVSCFAIGGTTTDVDKLLVTTPEEMCVQGTALPLEDQL